MKQQIYKVQCAGRNWIQATSKGGEGNTGRQEQIQIYIVVMIDD